MEPATADRPAGGYDALLGLEVLEATEDTVRALVPAHDGVKQPMGLVHGGLYASMAESMATLATGAAVAADGRTAHAMATHTSFLRPILDGTVHGVARRRHRGRTTWVWEVDVSDDDGRLCALVRVTVAVR